MTGTKLVPQNPMNSQGAQPYIDSTEHKIAFMNQRIEVLEEKVFKKVKRIRATESQRFFALLLRWLY